MLDKKFIESLIPDDNKPKGDAKLSQIIIQKSEKINSKSIPSLDKSINSFDNGCPTNDELKRIIKQRNNILSNLNQLKRYNDINLKKIKSSQRAFDVAITTLKSVKLSKKALSLAAKAVPSPPGLPGIVGAKINDLGDVVLNQMFTSTGLPKLEKVKSSLGMVEASVKLLSSNINDGLKKLNKLDLLIGNCVQDNEIVKLDKIPNDLKDIINKQKEEGIGIIKYKGYNIEIKEIPFKNDFNIKQNKAIATNPRSNKKFETESSFTLNLDTLIEEIKLKIDNIPGISKYEGQYIYTDYNSSFESETRHTWFIEDGKRINWSVTGISGDKKVSGNIFEVREKVSLSDILAIPRK